VQAPPVPRVGLAAAGASVMPGPPLFGECSELWIQTDEVAGQCERALGGRSRLEIVAGVGELAAKSAQLPVVALPIPFAKIVSET